MASAKAPLLTNEARGGRPARYNLNLRVSHSELAALRREYAQRAGDLGWQEWLRLRLLKGL